jgi:hypothetical protein
MDACPYERLLMMFCELVGIVVLQPVLNPFVTDIRSTFFLVLLALSRWRADQYARPYTIPVIYHIR